MSFFEVMRVGVFLVGKAFCWVLFGVGVRQFFVRGSFLQGVRVFVCGVSVVCGADEGYCVGEVVYCVVAVVEHFAVDD